MAFSAAVVAGSCVAGVFFGILITAWVIWQLLNRLRLPVRTLFGRPGTEAAREDDHQGLGRLQDIYEQMLNSSVPQVHHASEILPHFHGGVQLFVNNYLQGLGNGDGGRGPAQSALFEELAGVQDDWHHLHEFDLKRRRIALVQFICRNVHRRIIPDGDLDITVLPVDILSTYQRILTKHPPLPYPNRPPSDREFQLRRNTLSVEYWRALIAYWCSETFHEAKRRKLTRPNLFKMACTYGEAIHPTAIHMQEDDPRMPHLLAVEQGLIKALTPFFKMPDRPIGDGESSLEDSRPRQRLRKILELAADLGLTAFSSARPNEFYWPPTNKRPGADTSGNKGLIECFGVRQRFPVPGTEHGSNPVTTKIYYTPRWSDSDEYEGKGPKSEERLMDGGTRHVRPPKTCSLMRPPGLSERGVRLHWRDSAKEATTRVVWAGRVVVSSRLHRCTAKAG